MPRLNRDFSLSQITACSKKKFDRQVPRTTRTFIHLIMQLASHTTATNGTITAGGWAGKDKEWSGSGLRYQGTINVPAETGELTDRLSPNRDMKPQTTEYKARLPIPCRSGSSVGIATDYGLDGPESNTGGDEIFRPSRPVLRPIQPPVKWVPVLSRG